MSEAVTDYEGTKAMMMRITLIDVSHAVLSVGRRQDTLAEWVKTYRPLQGTDVVTWLTAEFHHLPRAENWPVMSTDWKTIHIMPPRSPLEIDSNHPTGIGK